MSIAFTIAFVAFLLTSAGRVPNKSPLTPRTALCISSRDTSGRTLLRPLMALFKNTAPEIERPRAIPSNWAKKID